MNRTELAHILRAAADIAGDGRILVIGSQSILATYPADELPETVTLSVEADIAFFDDAYNAKSDMVDGAIGEDSLFHQRFGYYGQGVSVSTATLPEGWEDRLVAFVPVDSEPAEGVCLDPVDLVVAKLVAGREKDLSFAADLSFERPRELGGVEGASSTVACDRSRPTTGLGLHRSTRSLTALKHESPKRVILLPFDTF